MPGIQINHTEFNNFLKSSNTQVSNENLQNFESIFTQADKFKQDGTAGADGILTGDEVPDFMSKINNDIRGLIDKFLRATDSEYAKNAPPAENQSVEQGQPVQKGPEIQQVECHRKGMELQQYRKTLQDAKDTLLENAKELGLTDYEIDCIKNIQTESITNGPARFDMENNVVKFNENDPNQPDKGSFIKIIMHEITHGVKKNDPYTQQTEIDCENRGISIALKLKNKGLINDFVIYGNENRRFMLSDVQDSKGQQEYMNEWLKNYQHLPK